MQHCRIYMVYGDYAVKYLIATSWHAAKQWMLDNGKVGYPWTDVTPPVDMAYGDEPWTQEWKDAMDLKIKEGMPVMADIEGDCVDIGGYQE